MLRLERWINRLARRGQGGERGQAMIMALIALTLGTLLITPTLNHMAAGVKFTTISQRLTSEVYAADAGAEYAMWCIKNDVSCDSPITVGGISVDITVSSLTELPYGPVINGGGTQSWRLQVSSELVDEGSNIFRYTITIENVGSSIIHLEEIGAGLPDGFGYIDDSTSGDITSENPQDPPPEPGKLIWGLSAPLPEVLSLNSKSHIFRIQGTGTPGGYYSWVTANVESIGTISSCLGYNVVSQAGTGTTIEANVVKNEGVVFPVSWKIN